MFSALALAGCGGESQATAPSATALPSAVDASSPVASPRSFTASSFSEPFTIELPPDWEVGDHADDMAAFYLPMGPNQGPRLGVDVQTVSQVFQDPCDTASATVDPGSSPDDLATWMGKWTPLHASKPVSGTISGHPAVIVDEDFDGTACANGNLWPTSGGYLDPQEHKRYAITEVGGKRVVVTLVGRDDTWESTLSDGQKVLESLTFTDT
jgi:hypothetical protein